MTGAAIVGLGALAAGLFAVRRYVIGADEAEERAIASAPIGEVTGDLELLDPAFRAPLERVLARLEARGYIPWVYETRRTGTRQEELFALGTSLTLESLHEEGLAADVIDGRTLPASSPNAGMRVGWGSWEGDDIAAAMAGDFFSALGAEVAAEPDLEWGGDWIGLVDQPHVELA